MATSGEARRWSTQEQSELVRDRAEKLLAALADELAAVGIPQPVELVAEHALRWAYRNLPGGPVIRRGRGRR